MQITEDIETGREYYARRTDSWTWVDGQEHWWEVFVVFHGLNGAGGAWITEHWRWNGSSQTLRRDTKSLSWQETRELMQNLYANWERNGLAQLQADGVTPV